VHTGARLGELLALRWSDIDFVAETLSVQRSLDYPSLAEGPSFRSPKTARGRRLIALAADTITVLREQRATQLEKRLRAAAAWNEGGLVFSDALGNPCRKFTVSRAVSRCAADLGLKGLRFHDLRHSAATLMLMAGVHPKVVSERLGHSTIAITLDTYSHVIPEMQRDGALALQALLRQG
jgi:integrase